MAYLGLVRKEDSVAVWFLALGVVFKVEVECGEGDDVVFRPSCFFHALKEVDFCNGHFTP